MAGNELFDAALRRAMAICAGREYCSNDVASKLESWGLGRADIHKAVKRLVNDRFIDDERFSSAFARDKFRYNKWGRIKIAAALRMKRIPEDIINRALESIDQHSYMETLAGLLASHRRTIKAKNQFDLKGKLMRYGLSKGYESHLLYDLLDNL